MKKDSLWAKYQDSLRNQFADKEKRNYINDEGFEVPKNTIAWIPYDNPDHKIDDVVESLIGHQNRDWFNHMAFAMCLPLTIANQYGFVVKAAHDAELFWDGTDGPVQVTSEGFNDMSSIQTYLHNFKHGVMSIENKFIMKTPPDVNIVVMQPPNHFVEGIHCMMGVVEADNLRRSFTFNLKVTTPNKQITIKKGDWLAAFMPVPRFYVENYKLVPAKKIFDKELINNEIYHNEYLKWERQAKDSFGGDLGRPNDSGRRYFKGIHVNNTLFKNHQKRITDK